MITASKLAIAIAVAGLLAAATVGKSSATPMLTSAVAAKAAAPAATDVQYRAYDYDPYAYRPYGGYPYPYGGYTYWYPAYPYWEYQHLEYREWLLLRWLASSECLEQSVARIFAQAVRARLRPARRSGFTRISHAGSPNVLSANLRQRCSPLTPMSDRAVYSAAIQFLAEHQL